MNTIHANIGDHLVSTRFCYTHHGIYIGDNRVIHYLDEDGVTIDSLATFSQGEEVYVREHPFRFYSAEESVDRAISRLGDDSYNVILNNCEHFVNWCINGLHVSRQVNTVAVVGGLAAREVAKRAAPTAVRSVMGTVATTSATNIVAWGTAATIAAVPVYKGLKNVVDNFELCDDPIDVASYFCEGVGDYVGETCESIAEVCGDVWDGLASLFD